MYLHRAATGKKYSLLHLQAHVLELVAGSAYTTTLMAPTKGPEDLLFERFQAKWISINQNIFETCANHEEITLIIQDTQVILWTEKTLEELHEKRDNNQ